MEFEITGYRAPEGVSELRLTAADVHQAERQAAALGYRVVASRSVRTLGGPLTWQWRRRFSLPLFSQELLTLLEAGLSLIEGIEALVHKARDDETRRITEALSRQLREGQSLSRAFESLPREFPPLFVATVRSSERTGSLPQALQRYLAYHRQIHAVRDKVVSASVYPVLLIVAGGLIIVFMLGYVVPRFAKIYADMGDRLPWMSRALLGWGHMVAEHGMVILAGGIFLLALLTHALTRPAARAAVGRFLWRLPTVGAHLRVYELARFTRSLAMLLKGGVPLVAALDMVGDLLHQLTLRDGLREATRAIREGRSVSDAFARHGLATETGVRMLVVGERSGELGEMMERIAGLYDDDVARWVEWFSRLFEPALMILIGAIIGLVVVLMYLPIFELASTIQ